MHGFITAVFKGVIDTTNKKRGCFVHPLFYVVSISGTCYLTRDGAWVLPLRSETNSRMI